MSEDFEHLCHDIGFRTFQYTQDDLIRLRECLRVNGMVISAALVGMGVKENWLDWLMMAEQIKEDQDFPEKRFSEETGVTRSSFRITREDGSEVASKSNLAI